MVSKKSRKEVRVKKHDRIRNRFSGTAERPRLAVFRSNSHMYAQIIDVAAAAYVGTLIAKRAIEKGIDKVVFDRGGFQYQGKVAALAEAAREAGLQF